ncbi:MAG TPA: NADH-quinone oxidoreductase subunit NuoF [Anaerolineaceae bacterium]
MNNLDVFRSRAVEEWQTLQSSPVPVIYFGTASCGRAAGAMQVMEAVRNLLAERGWQAKMVEVGCIGPCYLEPLMDIAFPGKPRLSYANMTSARAVQILTAWFEHGDFSLRFATGHFGEPQAFGANVPNFYDLPVMKAQVRVVLRNCGLIDPGSLAHYLARDGYRGLEQALAGSPEDALKTVMASGLRGRGGAGFPTAKKWELCRMAGGETRYLVCNADEGDPGAFMNRSLIEGDPHALLEGMLIAAYTIGAQHGYIYTRAEYPLAIERLYAAIAQAKEAGLLGENILGSGFGFDVTLKEGAGAFVCGEETALLASIEGRRGMPRSRPPFPAVKGLFGKPTVINNVETLATVPNIFRQGAEWYRQFGTPQNPGTKTFSLVGKVRRSGLIEAPLGATLRQIIFDIGGGTLKPFKAVQTGGPSGGCLSEKHLDMPVDYESLNAAGSIMGSGGLIVMDEDTCVVDVARYFLEFTQNESCGKCAPCRLGTARLVEILDRIVQGEGNLADLDRLESLARTVKQGSLCGLGQSAPNPVLTTLRYFREEYQAHIQEKYCPAAVCKDLYALTISDDCTGCQLCVRVCPTGAITGEKGAIQTLNRSACIQCRGCIDVCKFNAVIGIPSSRQPEKCAAVEVLL